jgi:hypothetical protein
LLSPDVQPKIRPDASLGRSIFFAFEILQSIKTKADDLDLNMLSRRTCGRMLFL